MSEDRDGRSPSLEPPSLFGRKRKKPAPARTVDPEPAETGETGETTRVAAPPDPDTIFDDTSEPTPETAPAVEAAREPGPPREPWLAGRPAAALTGLVVGGLIVAATWGSLRLCTEAKGTSSCGDQGFFLLVAILVVAVLVGMVILRLARVPEPGSTSFLAVGLLSVATLLFLVGSIFEWWMAVVIPLVSVATFLLAHWVASSYIGPES